MNNLEAIAKIVITLGLVAVVFGIFLFAASKLGWGGVRLPGDIVIRKGNFTFYFPWVTCIVISVILSLIFYLFGLFGRR